MGLICDRQLSHEAPFFRATCTDHWKVSLHSETLAGEWIEWILIEARERSAGANLKQSQAKKDSNRDLGEAQRPDIVSHPSVLWAFVGPLVISSYYRSKVVWAMRRVLPIFLVCPFPAMRFFAVRCRLDAVIVCVHWIPMTVRRKSSLEKQQSRLTVPKDARRRGRGFWPRHRCKGCH